jgi:hypothetical protein
VLAGETADLVVASGDVIEVRRKKPED